MNPGAFEGRLERERLHFNQIAQRAAANSLWMEADNILRYDNPPAKTPFPLEYVFHLLGPLENRTVVDLGCGDGLNTVILGALGARTISVDISDESLRLTAERARVNKVDSNLTLVHSDAAGIPIEDQTVDLVLCAAILHHVDAVMTARQIHRILKPGGKAVFLEPMIGPALLSHLKGYLPKSAGVTDDEQPLTREQVMAVSRSVGVHGRSRDFGLTMRLLSRAGVSSWFAIKTLHRVDAWVLNHFPFTRPLASPFVWEAIKASS